MDLIQKDTAGEPLSPVALITGGVGVALTLAAAFGLDLTAGQTAAIGSFVAFFAPVIVWWVGRRRTVPAANVVLQVAKSGDVVAGEASSLTTGVAPPSYSTIEHISPKAA